MKEITIPLINLICGMVVVFFAGFSIPLVLKSLGVNI